MIRLILILFLIFTISCENDSVGYEPVNSWAECTLFEKNLIFGDGAAAGKITGKSISDSILISYDIGNSYVSNNNYLIDELHFSISDDPTGLYEVNGTNSTKHINIDESAINKKTYRFAVKPYDYGIHSRLIYASANALIIKSGSSDDGRILIFAESDGLSPNKQGYFTFEYNCKKKN